MKKYAPQSAEKMLDFDTAKAIQTCESYDDAKFTLKTFLNIALSSVPQADSFESALSVFNKKAEEFLAGYKRKKKVFTTYSFGTDYSVSDVILTKKDKLYVYCGEIYKYAELTQLDTTTLQLSMLCPPQKIFVYAAARHNEENEIIGYNFLHPTLFEKKEPALLMERKEEIPFDYNTTLPVYLQQVDGYYGGYDPLYENSPELCHARKKRILESLKRITASKIVDEEKREIA